MRAVRAFALPVLLVAAALLTASRPAFAQAPLLSTFGGAVGFGTNCLSPNDDGSSNEVDLTRAFPGGLRFFRDTHTRAFVNTNGNISFTRAVSTYTPSAFPIASQPMIAPYWADVDIRPAIPDCGGFGGSTSSPGNGACRNPSSNGVWWHLEPGRMVVTWHRVGYFSCHDDHIMNFQLVLTDARACGAPGDFDVEFRYNVCDWTTGDASGGTGGFGGTPAQAGFDAGDRVNFRSIMGSLMSDIHTRLCRGSNAGIPGIWHFIIRNGEVNGDAGMQSCGVGACAVVASFCNNGMPAPCMPGTPSPEVCDGIDNNCDGMIDNGQLECGRGACRNTAPICVDGRTGTCVPLPRRREICDNNIDDDCDGVVDQGCRNDAGSDTDASDARDEALCGDPPCGRRIPLEGRAGPIGTCTCRTIGLVPVSRNGALASVLVAALAVMSARRRRPRS